MTMEMPLHWKPLKLEGPIVSGEMDGLIGIEELTDYDLNVVLRGRNKRGKKRKIVELEPIETKKTKISTTKNTPIKSDITNNRKPGAFVRSPNFAAIKKNSENLPLEVTENISNVNSLETKVSENTTKKKRNKNDAELNKPTDIIKKNKKKSNKTEKQPKIEIGAKKENSETDLKYTIDDLKAWSLVSLPEVILCALADLGFTKPTPIQELTLPPAILGRRDILGAAETGSGKTLAFGLPILSGILEHKDKSQIDESDEEVDDDESDFEEKEEDIDEINENGIGCVRSIDNVEYGTIFQKPLKPLYALILTPTRELAVQIKNHLAAAAKYTGIRVAVVLGGMAAVKQERILGKGPEIVVATPGRLWELIKEGNPHLSQVDDIRYLAIDETDRMLERGHYQELHQLLERINMDEKKKQLRQNFVFSATLTLVHDLPRHLLTKKKMKNKFSKKISKITPDQKLNKIIEMLGITDPKIVDVTQATGTASSLTECRINCPIEEKDYYLYYFLQQHPGRTLIFCNSIGCVKRLSTLLGLLGCTTLPLHASMQQRQRLRNLERFRDDACGVLVATDVAARGLDIPKVEHVLHYQTPRTSEGYVHRSGRTARASEQGITVLLIEPNEIPNYHRLCRTLGRTEDLAVFPVFENLLNAVKQRINLARDLDKLELKSRRANAESGWLQKAAEDMDMIVNDSDESDGESKQDEARFKREVASKRKQLAAVLSKPLFPRGFSFKYPTRSGDENIPLVQGEQVSLKAVDVMKHEIDNPAKRGKHRKLYKAKISTAEKKAEKRVEKAVAKRNKRKLKRDKKEGK